MRMIVVSLVAGRRTCVVECPVRVDVGEGGQLAGLALLEEGRVLVRDLRVLLVQQQEAEVPGVVTGPHPLRGEPVEDRRQVDPVREIAQAIRDARERVDPVRERRREDRRIEMVAGRECGSRLPEERQVLPAVVADRVDVVGAQPAVAGAAGPLHPRSVVRVIGVAERAALEVGCERERLVRDACRVGVGEAGLPAVGSG